MCHFLVGGHICAEDLFCILLFGYWVMKQSCAANRRINNFIQLYYFVNLSVEMTFMYTYM
jgi:hypothetical protein